MIDRLDPVAYLNDRLVGSLGLMPSRGNRSTTFLGPSSTLAGFVAVDRGDGIMLESKWHGSSVESRPPEHSTPEASL